MKARIRRTTVAVRELDNMAFKFVEDSLDGQVCWSVTAAASLVVATIGGGSDTKDVGGTDGVEWMEWLGLRRG